MSEKPKSKALREKVGPDPAHARVFAQVLRDDGEIPNSILPLLIYEQVLVLSAENPGKVFEDLFKLNGWGDAWRNGIYSYHHYHSTAHEVLGVFCGTATVKLGGESGIERKIRAGDVVIIPAGVGHKNLGSSPDFAIVGAYPAG